MFGVLVSVSLLISIVDARSHTLGKILIAKGKRADLINLPYQCALEKHEKHHCGAAIIGIRTVITAAHCCGEYNTVQNYQVRVGTPLRETGGEVFPVYDFVKHYAYRLVDDSEYFFDIAIVWIKGNMDFDNQYIKPVALPSKGDCEADTEAIVAGWGLTWSNGIKTKQLQFAKIPIWEQAICGQIYGYKKVGEETLCAGGYKDGAGPCKGDSGGALVANGKLCGIVSGGRSCGAKEKPAVFTRVEFFLKWIELALYSGPKRK